MKNLLLKSSLLLTMPGGAEWILIFVVILLFFGGRKIPQLMQGFGKGIKEFKNAKDNVKNKPEL